MHALAPAGMAWICLLALCAAALPQSPAVADAAGGLHDSDRDGLSDALEQALLTQFVPAFQVAAGDCAGLPARFAANLPDPTVQAEDGVVYGQVTPRPVDAGRPAAIEIHYYHLWKRDCGRMGHPLDAEHVSVLLRAEEGTPGSGKWRAAYWYAAAHEETLCDASQIVRASTLHAEDRGATVFLSAGKHASFLSPELCRHGCGSDRCGRQTPLTPAGLVNLGESGAPTNGALWAASPRWPLAAKMARTDFQPAVIARLERLPETDIAWVNPGKHPARATIAVSSATADAIAHGGQNADTAISVAGASTGNALSESRKDALHALGAAARWVGKTLHATPPEKNKPRP